MSLFNFSKLHHFNLKTTVHQSAVHVLRCSATHFLIGTGKENVADISLKWFQIGKMWESAVLLLYSSLQPLWRLASNHLLLYRLLKVRNHYCLPRPRLFDMKSFMFPRLILILHALFVNVDKTHLILKRDRNTTTDSHHIWPSFKVRRSFSQDLVWLLPQGRGVDQDWGGAQGPDLGGFWEEGERQRGFPHPLKVCSRCCEHVWLMSNWFPSSSPAGLWHTPAMFEDDNFDDYDVDFQLSPERGWSPPPSLSPLHGFPSPTGPSSDASAVMQSEGEGMSQSSVQVFGGSL